MLSNFTGSKAIIFAPMAGISDSPSRKIAKEFDVDIVISELISAEGIIRDCRRTWHLAAFDNSERPIGLQIFGARPSAMAEAAGRLSSLEPDFIDINFGCPAPKIVGKNGGSSILKDLPLLKTIVSEVVKAVSIPITVKMRAGWDSSELTYIEAGKIAEDCGVAAITLHPRTKSQGFSGKSEWSMIAELKQALKIPVIGNGDIFTPEDAATMFEQTGCDGVMIGRGAMGNPWIFSRTKQYIQSGILAPEPAPADKINMALRLYDMMVEFYGLPGAIFRMRSQLCYYLKGLPGSSEIKPIMMRLLSLDEIREILYRYRDSLEAGRDIKISA
jgi:tRNA-dihydrouridine synthase B